MLLYSRLKGYINVSQMISTLGLACKGATRSKKVTIYLRHYTECSVLVIKRLASANQQNNGSVGRSCSEKTSYIEAFAESDASDVTLYV